MTELKLARAKTKLIRAKKRLDQVHISLLDLETHRAKSILELDHKVQEQSHADHVVSCMTTEYDSMTIKLLDTTKHLAILTDTINIESIHIREIDIHLDKLIKHRISADEIVSADQAELDKVLLSVQYATKHNISSITNVETSAKILVEAEIDIQTLINKNIEANRIVIVDKTEEANALLSLDVARQNVVRSMEHVTKTKTDVDTSHMNKMESEAQHCRNVVILDDSVIALDMVTNDVRTNSSRLNISTNNAININLQVTTTLVDKTDSISRLVRYETEAENMSADLILSTNDMVRIRDTLNVSIQNATLNNLAVHQIHTDLAHMDTSIKTMYIQLNEATTKFNNMSELILSKASETSAETSTCIIM